MNIARQAEGATGLVRWLRPSFQAAAEQAKLAATHTSLPVEPQEPTDRPRWPTSDPERFVALRAALAASPGRPADLSRRFQRAPAAKVGEILEILTALGQAHRDAEGRYRA